MHSSLVAYFDLFRSSARQCSFEPLKTATRIARGCFSMLGPTKMPKAMCVSNHFLIAFVFILFCGFELFPYLIAYLSVFFGDYNSDSQSGSTALSFFADRGRADSVQLLIDAGADLDTKNNVR